MLSSDMFIEFFSGLKHFIDFQYPVLFFFHCSKVLLLIVLLDKPCRIFTMQDWGVFNGCCHNNAKVKYI